jgi:hypothetical protein
MSLHYGVEDHGLVDTLRKHVMDNDMEALLALLDTLRVQYPTGLGFDRLDSENRTALQAACAGYVNPEITRILLDPLNVMYGGYPDNINNLRQSALHQCVATDHHGFPVRSRQNARIKARMLLEHGANVSLPGEHLRLRSPPVFWIDSVEMATLLFEFGGERDINHTNLQGDTLLQRIVSSGDVDLCRILFQHGADINVGSRLRPFVHGAIMGYFHQRYHVGGTFNEVDMLELVLKNGADINALDWGGRSVLVLAHTMGLTHAVRLIKLIIAEIPTAREKWIAENLNPVYQSIIMSQHKRDGGRSGLCRMTPEIIQQMIYHISRSIPTNLVPYVMESIKNRNNGRFPIWDPDDI